MIYNKILKTTSHIALIAGLMSVPIYAQEKNKTEEETKEVAAPPSKANDNEEIDAELAKAEKLEKLSDPIEFLKNFALQEPLIALPQPEAERLAVAEKIMTLLYPVGTNERIVRHSLDDLMIPMIDRTLELTLKEAIDLFDLPKDIMGNVPQDEANIKFIDLLTEEIPDFRDRMKIVMDAHVEITGLSSEPIEPMLAKAMARDYARKYNLSQLNDLAEFFDTPTGNMFARDFMLSTYSVDMVQTALMNMPKTFENYAKIEEVSKRMQEAFKMEPPKDVIDDTDETECDDECDIEEEEEEKETNDDLGDEPWFTNGNWDDDTRDNVSKLEDTYNELAELSEQAYEQYDEAFDAAVAKSREKYIADGWTREDEDTPE